MALFFLFSFWGLRPPKTADGDSDWAKLMRDQGLAIDDDLPPERMFTKQDLADSADRVYLAILGRVYDVTEGKAHYGPGGGYEFFAGQLMLSLFRRCRS